MLSILTDTCGTLCALCCLTAAAAGQTADQQQQQENVPYPYTYDDDLLRGHEYDELGDKWGPGTGDVDQQKDGQQQQNGQQQQEGQQQQQEGGVPDGQGQGLRDLGDDSYGWKGDMWDDEMFRQVRIAQRKHDKPASRLTLSSA